MSFFFVGTAVRNRMMRTLKVLGPSPSVLFETMGVDRVSKFVSQTPCSVDELATQATPCNIKPTTILRRLLQPLENNSQTLLKSVSVSTQTDIDVPVPLVSVGTQTDVPRVFVGAQADANDIDLAFQMKATDRGINTNLSTFISYSLTAMKKLQDKQKPNVLFHFAKILANGNLDVDRMPMGLLEYTIMFKASTHVRQVFIMDLIYK